MTTVVIDLSVVCHQLYRRLNGIYDIGNVAPRMFTDPAILAEKLIKTEKALAAASDKEAKVKLTNERDNILTKQHTVGAVTAQLSYMMSLDWLSDLKPTDDTRIILVCDSKPYWRLTYLERPSVFLAAYDYRKANAIGRMKKSTWAKVERLRELLQVSCPDISTGTAEEWEEYQNVINERNALVEELKISYKAGRKFPDPAFTKLKKAIYDICDRQGWNRIAIANYEADDIAAAVVKTVSPDEKVILGTVDSDWLGLVNENTSWYCISGYFPRLRNDLQSINEWRTKKKEPHLDQPSDMWAEKVRCGDSSDALPPGSPIEVIDLLNPPIEHRLWLNEYFQDQLAKSQYRPLVSGDRAAEYLQYLGCRLVIDPFFWDQTCAFQRPGASDANG